MIPAGWFTVSIVAVAFLSAMATAVYGWLARCRHIKAGGFFHGGSWYYIEPERARFPESENVREEHLHGSASAARAWAGDLDFDSTVVRGLSEWRGPAGRVARRLA